MPTPSAPATEQRASPRYQVSLRCDLYHEGHRIEATTKDLSRGGLSTMSKQPLAVSSPLQIELALVFGADAASESLSLPAIVVWCTALKGGFQIGARFGRLPTQTADYLDVFLRFLGGEVEAPASRDRAANGADLDDQIDDDPDDDPDDKIGG